MITIVGLLAAQHIGIAGLLLLFSTAIAVSAYFGEGLASGLVATCICLLGLLVIVRSGLSPLNVVELPVVAIFILYSAATTWLFEIALHRNRGKEIQRQQSQHNEERADRLEKTNISLQRSIEQQQVTEDALIASNARLQQSNIALESFASVASHDLQEPLRKIRAFGDLLLQQYSDQLEEEGRLYVDRMQNAAERMQNLVNDILMLARVTSDASPKTQIDLGGVLSTIIYDLETEINHSAASVGYDTLPIVTANATQMYLLFSNLLRNALKFHRKGVPPVIEIRSKIVSPEESGLILGGVKVAGIRIEVEDNGIGFDEKYLPKIFGIFQRLHGRDQYEGTGVGLSTCQKIVEVHHGTISAQSVPGRGSTFIVTFPIVVKEEHPV